MFLASIHLSIEDMSMQTIVFPCKNNKNMLILWPLV